MNTKTFQDNFMALCRGQQMLPQRIFREFLDWFQSASDSDMSAKQDAANNSGLNTTDKTIVGAINEVRTTANSAKNTADEALPVKSITYDDDGHLFITVGEVQYKIDATPVEASE